MTVETPAPAALSAAEQEVVDSFHRLYYDSDTRTWKNTYWLGTPVQKCPLDLWVYQELLHRLRPDLIVECGTFDGGSAFFMATICDLVGNGRILTIDVEPRPGRPQHDRVTYYTGSTISPDILATVRQAAAGAGTVLVILDSDHSKAHVLEELRHYQDLVTVGSYMIVEDSNINGRPVLPDFGPGPTEAMEDFLRETEAYERDPAWEKFFLTFNPGGFLRRVR